MKKRRDLKILWNSNAVNTNSGYAVFTRDLLFRLLKDGWDVANIGFFGVDGYHTYMNGEDLIDDRFKGLKLKVLPKMNDPYGSDAILNHSIDLGANVVFTMQDLHTIQTKVLQELNNKGIKFIPYFPIDQDPIYNPILTNLNQAYKLISFSKYGHKVLQDSGYASNLIVEGIDTEIFKPMDKAKCREFLKLPQDVFIFGMIGANKENPPRKGYQEAMEAFKMFAEKHSEARIFFHTQQTAPMGFPIMDFASFLGIRDKIFFLNGYTSSFKADSHHVAKELNAFDILLHPSQTEGFGLVPIEAQACGIPPIVNNCHSQPEMIVDGITGEICEKGKGWYRNQNAYVYPADVSSLYNKMESLYNKVKDDKQRFDIQKKARQHVLNNYNIDKLVNEKWIPFLEDLQEELLTAK